MTEQRTRDRIDAHWAAQLGCTLEDLREPRVAVLAHSRWLAEYRGVYALCGSGSDVSGLVISAPPDREAALGAALRAATPATVFDEHTLSLLCSPGFTRVIGPSSLAYADATDFHHAEGVAGVRRLSAADSESLAVLRQACDPVEWEHGGVHAGRETIYGCFDGGVLVAAASWEIQGDVRHIGVVTHPAHRSRGFARAVASAVTSQALVEGVIPQWQTLLSNAASMAVGRRLGYVERFRSIAVRLG